MTDEHQTPPADGDAARFEHTLTVEPADLDELGHVNNVVYLRWIQEIAAAHWRSTADEELARSLVWVVLRHEIDYEEPALAGDELTVRTWVGRAAGARWDRHTDVLRRGRVLARARSVWCPLNATTGRPRRVDARLLAVFHPPSPDPSEDRARDPDV